MNARSRRARVFLIFGGIFLTLLLAAVITLGSLRVPFEPHAWNELVILYALSTFIVATLLVFGLILGRTLVRLWAERRAEQLGSRFKVKMVLGAMAISLLPLVFLFFVSFALMNRTLLRWFPRSLEMANYKSRQIVSELNRADYMRMAALAARAAALASDLQANPKVSIEAASRFAMEHGAEAVWATGADGKILQPDDPLISPLTRDPTLKYQSELSSGGALWQTRSAALLTARVPFGSGSLFVAKRLPVDFASRTSEIESQTAEYSAQWDQIRTFKRQILLTLSLFTLLLLFAVTWSGLYLAKLVVVPIQALAEATQKVAAGNFDTQVEVQATDELGALVRSFNNMTSQLADSRRQIDEFTHNLQQAIQELDRRRALIEAVLENVPTGVLTIESDGHISRMNRAARELFGPAVKDASTLAGLTGADAARHLQHLIRRSLRLGAASQELDFEANGHLVRAAVTISPLGARRSNAGYVVVVDDLTELLRAQKAAAWQEVAQRIAHEIKNPLTPIQLSAERLSRYISRHNGEAVSSGLSHLVGECAALITREVGTLSALVNEFAQFARFPVPRLAPTDPNAIVLSALKVFQGRLEDVHIRTTLEEVPPIKADSEMLCRVIVNLIDNAAEAMEGSAMRNLELSTRFRSAHDTVEISVADTGHGISPEDKDKLFLPHFSTRDRGTGLGLAIASRVVAEHHGLLRAEDNSPVGARFVIELPAADSVAAAATLSES